MDTQKIYDMAGVTEGQLKKLDGIHDLVEIFHGIDEDGSVFYAYMAIYPSKYMEYKNKIHNQEDLNLEDYGRILYSGKGDIPSAEIQQQMEEEHGIDHAHMTKFNQAILEVMSENQ